MKLRFASLGQFIILLIACIAEALSPARTELKRRGENPKPKPHTWPPFRNSANDRGASQARKPSPSKSNSPNPNSPKPSLKRGRGPSPKPEGAVSSKIDRGNSPKLPPSPSGSSSFSKGSWDRTGFTSSSATSSSGSERYRSAVDPVTAKAIANGPAIIKTKTGNAPAAYKEFKKWRAGTETINDLNKVQAAVRARRGGTGYVSASQALNIGDSHKVTVDARKSKVGGWLDFGDSNGRWEREHVSPGTKDTRWGGHKVAGFVHGPGKVSIRTKNGGFVDTDASSSSQGSG